jgi:hypothetical protein
MNNNFNFTINPSSSKPQAEENLNNNASDSQTSESNLMNNNSNTDLNSVSESCKDNVNQQPSVSRHNNNYLIDLNRITQLEKNNTNAINKNLNYLHPESAAAAPVENKKQTQDWSAAASTNNIQIANLDLNHLNNTFNRNSNNININNRNSNNNNYQQINSASLHAINNNNYSLNNNSSILINNNNNTSINQSSFNLSSNVQLSLSKGTNQTSACPQEPPSRSDVLNDKQNFASEQVVCPQSVKEPIIRNNTLKPKNSSNSLTLNKKEPLSSSNSINKNMQISHQKKHKKIEMEMDIDVGDEEDKNMNSTITSRDSYQNAYQSKKKEGDAEDFNYDIMNLDMEINGEDSAYSNGNYVWNFEDYFTI